MNELTTWLLISSLSTGVQGFFIFLGLTLTVATFSSLFMAFQWRDVWSYRDDSEENALKWIKRSKGYFIYSCVCWLFVGLIPSYQTMIFISLSEVFYPSIRQILAALTVVGG